MANRIHKLTIPSSTRYLEDVRQFVEIHAEKARLPEDSVQQLKMAVDEACANVIEHAYSGNTDQPIDIAVIVKPDRFTVRIRDEGVGFNPDAYQEPDLARIARSRRAGGLGVHIMHRLMDQVEYRQRGRTNECCLTKYRR
ncbi:MAG: ATP-binding protein [Rhodothermales bacterium]|nr:ATP-binding protein [Rhodothermales bacterium]